VNFILFTSSLQTEQTKCKRISLRHTILLSFARMVATKPPDSCTSHVKDVLKMTIKKNPFYTNSRKIHTSSPK